MRTATLTIAAPDAAPFATIEDAQILDGDIVRARAQRDGTLEQEAVEVVFTAPDLGGEALPHLLPTGRLRARLVLGSETIIDGATQREMIACSSAATGGERDWTVRVQDEATRELWDRLEALDLAAVKGDVVPVTLSTVVAGGTPADQSWYPVAALALACLGRVATVTSALPVFNSGLRYLLLGDPALYTPADLVYMATAPDPDRADSTYPQGTAKALIEALMAAHAWTLRVSYAAFPSDALVVEVVDGRWAEAGPSVTLDTLAEDEWDVSVQPADQEDLALTMAVGETDSAHGYLSDLGGYAARTWRRGLGGEPANRTTVDLSPFALPSYEWTATTTATVTYSAYYTEDQLRARPAIEADATDVWHLVVVHDGHAIIERRPDAPAPGFIVQLETWPAALYPCHALSAYSRVEVRGAFDVEGVALPGVGSAGRVGVDGLSLSVVEASVNEDTFSATLTLARPVPEYDAVAAFPPALPPVALAGVILATTPPGGYWMRVTWSPDARTMLPVSYEVERDGVSGWEAVTTVYGDPRVPYAEISGLGADDSQIVRVRSLYVTGAVSEWTTEVLP